MTKPSGDKNKLTASVFEDSKFADAYDDKFAKLSPINENLHFLIQLILQELPSDANILCVGAGTGTEIIKLANAYPGWCFKAVEPSAPMLKVCQDKLQKHGILSRCELVHGYLSDVSSKETFDAVLCLLVTQFVKDQQARQEMFCQMSSQLKPGGYLINAEISADMSSSQFNDLAEKWKTMHAYSGASAEGVSNMIKALQDNVSVEPPAIIESYLRKSDFSLPIQFFQSLLIHAWYAQKK